MAALAPDMIITLEVVTVLVYLVSPADWVSCVVLHRQGFVEGVHKVKSAFWALCRRSRGYPFSDLVLIHKVVARGGLSNVSCAISGVLALVSVAILRIWFGLESGLLWYVSSLGVPRVAPSLVSASRLTLFDLASARHARWSRFSRVPASSSLVKCVNVKSLQVSTTSMWWEIFGFETAPPFGCSSLVLSDSYRLCEASLPFGSCWCHQVLGVSLPTSFLGLDQSSYRLWFSVGNRVRVVSSFVESN
ncbi:unnamed protein product [Brassica oleracea var. botrytis]|uniref:uncharacterized protein LOC106300760 n=1 Tax=Brassica oleracea var. oleracea TaxID=109376 RepID=UPI0006A6F4EB|nr:PREDICTED: uncharacterized protein LOC106300760 [Brassica oleracea var. oleracea]